MARGGRQRGDQKEVHQVPKYDRQQGLESIEEHWWFRHHRGRPRMPTIYVGCHSLGELTLVQEDWESRRAVDRDFEAERTSLVSPR